MTALHLWQRKAWLEKGVEASLQESNTQVKKIKHKRVTNFLVSIIVMLSDSLTVHFLRTCLLYSRNLGTFCLKIKGTHMFIGINFIYDFCFYFRILTFGKWSISSPNQVKCLSPQILFFLRFHFFIHERHREAETQAERVAGSLQGAQYGTRSQDPRIMTWAKGRCSTIEPSRHPDLIFLNKKTSIWPCGLVLVCCFFLSNLVAIARSNFKALIWEVLWRAYASLFGNHFKNCKYSCCWGCIGYFWRKQNDSAQANEEGGLLESESSDVKNKPKQTKTIPWVLTINTLNRILRIVSCANLEGNSKKTSK